SLSPPLPLLLDSHPPRGLGKLKRFLSTLVQFGSDIAPDTGDRVRALVLSLVSSSISIEEFHHSLQDVTNFPLRPFVVPFLRAHLPLLQRELGSLARLAKQVSIRPFPLICSLSNFYHLARIRNLDIINTESPQQYLRHHEHVVLDPAFSPSEPSEIFHSEVADSGKRRAPDSSCVFTGKCETSFWKNVRNNIFTLRL
ncbi:hypothetical protein ANN_24200, partial [Periplaneta americana]